MPKPNKEVILDQEYESGQDSGEDSDVVPALELVEVQPSAAGPAKPRKRPAKALDLTVKTPSRKKPKFDLDEDGERIHEIPKDESIKYKHLIGM